eukprot:Opistho-2@52094
MPAALSKISVGTAYCKLSACTEGTHASSVMQFRRQLMQASTHYHPPGVRQLLEKESVFHNPRNVECVWHCAHTNHEFVVWNLVPVTRINAALAFDHLPIKVDSPREGQMKVLFVAKVVCASNVLLDGAEFERTNCSARKKRSEQEMVPRADDNHIILGLVDLREQTVPAPSGAQNDQSLSPRRGLIRHRLCMSSTSRHCGGYGRLPPTITGGTTRVASLATFSAMAVVMSPEITRSDFVRFTSVSAPLPVLVARDRCDRPAGQSCPTANVDPFVAPDVGEREYAGAGWAADLMRPKHKRAKPREWATVGKVADINAERPTRREQICAMSA